MSKVRPAFWQPQPRLPLTIRRFLQTRIEAALADPLRRTLLVWPAILGAPVQILAHPEGIPEARLFDLATPLVGAVHPVGPEAVWMEDLRTHSDTAERGAIGWTPHPLWRDFAAVVSLRTAVALLALTGQPGDERYVLSSAVSLFNLSLFHECHDALEILWRQSEGELKTRLQGLILLACGFHHQQHLHAPGMLGVWRGGISHLEGASGVLDTPWGRVSYAGSLAKAMQRLEWLKTKRADDDWARFWEMPSPEWEFT